MWFLFFGVTCLLSECPLPSPCFMGCFTSLDGYRGDVVLPYGSISVVAISGSSSLLSMENGGANYARLTFFDSDQVLGCFSCCSLAAFFNIMDTSVDGYPRLLLIFRRLSFGLSLFYFLQLLVSCWAMYKNEIVWSVCNLMIDWQFWYLLDFLIGII